MTDQRTLPIIHAIHDIDYGGRFQIQQLDLEFSNGARRRFERMKPRGFGGVVIAALRDDQTILLTREYAAGLHQYLLGLPTGRIDPGESALQAANRELKEEAGFGATCRQFYCPELRLARRSAKVPNLASRFTCWRYCW